jgi:uncharacterized membrane protein YesL
MDLIKKFLKLLWVNFLWLICCLPVITAGGATCAAYAVTLRLADDDEEVGTFSGITRRFFKALKQDLLQGFFIFLFTAACVSLGYFLFDRARDYGFNLIIIAALAVYVLVVLIFNMYAYPLIARYSNTFINTLRNAVALYAMNTKASFKTLGFVILEIVILYFTKRIYFAGILILPSVIFYTVSRTAKNIFFRMENPE